MKKYKNRVTLLHFDVQERERNVAGGLTGSTSVHGHCYGKRATAGGRRLPGEPICPSESRLRPPYDSARAT